MKTPIRTVTLVLASCLCRAVGATPIDYTVRLDPDLFGRLNQKDVTSCVKKPDDPSDFGKGCGPAAAVNSFAYLERRYPAIYGGGLIPSTGKNFTDEDLVRTAEDLARNFMGTDKDNGTFIYDFIGGKRKYIEGKRPGKTRYAAEVDPAKNLADDTKVTRPEDVVRKVPSWQFLHGNLKSEEDVEVLVNAVTLDADGKVTTIDTTVGHYITAVMLEWIDVDLDDVIDKSENAKLGYVDPVGGVLKSAGIFQNSLNGPILSIGPTTGKTFGVTGVIKESPIPEPATLSLLVLALAPLLGRLRT